MSGIHFWVQFLLGCPAFIPFLLSLAPIGGFVSFKIVSLPLLLQQIKSFYGFTGALCNESLVVREDCMASKASNNSYQRSVHNTLKRTLSITSHRQRSICESFFLTEEAFLTLRTYPERLFLATLSENRLNSQ